ncbi:MAG: TetR/AcrR family transcriptional regulator [Propionicimonas sp.]
MNVSPKRAQTQDRLLDAAVALFAEKGVLGASVEEICERAGFTRGAFYSNFASKDELLIATMERKGEEILQAARQATASVPGERIEPASVDDVVRQAMVVFLASHPIDRQWLLAREEMRLYALRNPAVREPLRGVEESLDSLLTEAIADVIERQRAVLSLPPQQLVMLLESYCEELATQALLGGDEPDDDEVAARLAQVVRHLVVFPEEDA